MDWHNETRRNTLTTIIDNVPTLEPLVKSCAIVVACMALTKALNMHACGNTVRVYVKDSLGISVSDLPATLQEKLCPTAAEPVAATEPTAAAEDSQAAPPAKPKRFKRK